MHRPRHTPFLVTHPGKAVLSILFAIGLATGRADAQQVLTFDEVSPDPFIPVLGSVTCAGSTGFQFVSNHFHILGADFSGFATNGTPLLGYESGRGFPISMERVGGGTFSLLAFDAGEFYVPQHADRPNADQLTLTGHLQGGGTVTHTVFLDGLYDGAGGVTDLEHFVLPASFTSLTSVTFTGHRTAGGDGGIQIDNLTYQVAAPVTLPACVVTAVAPSNPTVTMTSPSAGNVSGTVNVRATATDDTGVTSVQFKLDGVNLGAADTTAPYGISWDTTTVANGAHTLSADAVDTDGNVGTTSVAVTVTNFPPDDVDGDTLPNDWETRFGLNPSSAVGDNGRDGDPDGDGRTNIQEFDPNPNLATHPRGFFHSLLAEGAENDFFDVRIALLNVGTTPGRVLIRYLQPGLPPVSEYEVLPPGRRSTRGRPAAVTSPDFSTVVESDEQIVLDRTMTWGGGYGSHAETGVAGPATTWYLAEGSTSGVFSLFYLIQNPNPAATTLTVRYLLPGGQAPIERSYPLPGFSRTTIHVDDQGGVLASTDVSAVLTAPLPIVVERAMYRSTPTQAFAAGHNSAGVTAPASSWFLAEGATGPFFDCFILLANPNDRPVTATIDYLLSDGRTFTKAYSVPANGRFTVWVDNEEIGGAGVRPLANVAVSSTVTATLPIIVERTMWWPSPETASDYWTEAHNSPGATATATAWALAEGEVGGSQNAETYILIANTSTTPGNARVTLYFEDGTSVNQTFALLPRSRRNVSVSVDFPSAAGRRFGSVIESLGTPAAEIVVERAMYTSPGGAIWSAGTNALASRRR